MVWQNYDVGLIINCQNYLIHLGIQPSRCFLDRVQSLFSITMPLVTSLQSITISQLDFLAPFCLFFTFRNINKLTCNSETRTIQMLSNCFGERKQTQYIFESNQQLNYLNAIDLYHSWRNEVKPLPAKKPLLSIVISDCTSTFMFIMLK